MMLFNVSPALTSSALIVAMISLITLIIRYVGPWRKQADEVADALRNDLLRRVTKLERTLERERGRHNAERALDRHRLNNMTACFDAMLLLLEMSPERATEVVGKIKEMRARQIVAEAEEKAIITAAELAHVAEEEADEDE